MLDNTIITPPRVPFTDARTGLISREWYRFFLSLFRLTGEGGSSASLEDIQLAPPAQNTLPDLQMAVDALRQEVQTMPRVPTEVLDLVIAMLGGPVRVNVVTKTAAYTVTALDYTVLCDASAGAFTVTLPAAASVYKQVFVIKKTDSSGNAVTIDGNGSETIDGSTTAPITTPNLALMLQSTGSAWVIL